MDAVVSGFADPTEAAAAVQRVPQNLRAGWIDAVAERLASVDPVRALRWIEEFQEEPSYADWVTTIVEGAASRDPAFSARLLASGDEVMQRNINR